MDQLLNHVRGFSFGGMTYERGGLFGPILRPYLSLIVVSSGTCTLVADGKRIEVSGGQTGMAAAQHKFEFDYHKGEETTAVWCEGFLPAAAFSGYVLSRPELTPITTSTNIRQLCQLGLGTGHTSQPDLNALRDALGQAICKAYIYQAGLQQEDISIPLNILRARRFIQEHLSDETVNVTTIADHAGVTPQHLISSFKRHIGATPSRYLWRMRANRARQLLIHTELSQSEIAFSCGYRSQPHYSRSIKSLFGMAPAQLRRDMGFTRPSDTDASVRDQIF